MKEREAKELISTAKQIIEEYRADGRLKRSASVPAATRSEILADLRRLHPGLSSIQYDLIFGAGFFAVTEAARKRRRKPK